MKPAFCRQPVFSISLNDSVFAGKHIMPDTKYYYEFD